MHERTRAALITERPVRVQKKIHRGAGAAGAGIPSSPAPGTRHARRTARTAATVARTWARMQVQGVERYLHPFLQASVGDEQRPGAVTRITLLTKVNTRQLEQHYY